MRLTEKDYCGYDIKGRKNFHGYVEEEDHERLFAALQKLGQLEDIEEKHNIKSIDDLDKRLTALEIIREKGIDILEFRATRKAKTYNEHTKRVYVKDYADEEFNLLKEIMK